MSTFVDASVLVAALVVAGPEGRWAEEVVASDVLLAPELAWVETANVLRRLQHTGKLTASKAQAAFGDLMQVRLEVFTFAPFALRIWQPRHNRSCYDAWYVALAEAVKLPLAALDRRLSSAKGPTCAFLLPPLRRARTAAADPPPLPRSRQRPADLDPSRSRTVQAKSTADC